MESQLAAQLTAIQHHLCKTGLTSEEKGYEDPVRRVLKDQHQFLTEFRQTFFKQLANLNVGEAEAGDPPEKTAKLNYRIKHLVRSLEEEERTKDARIKELQEQNRKLKYRISHLLKHVD